MKSNYKRIGDFIQLVDVRNDDLAVDTLLGLSISKQFIPSVANTIGTNMKKYKIIKRNQFACSIMQVRRDKKMPVALLKDIDEAIISQAYPVFEVIDDKEVLPEYLMMWFSRAEFDRQATFWAIGGVRGSLEWDDFLNFEFPKPEIEEQRAIVAEYKTVNDRIQLNEQINTKLEETAQALYRHWFVDFEFPNDNGKPYKSSGGKMVWNEELEKEVPEGWEVESISKYFDCNIENISAKDNFNEIRYYDTSSVTNNVFDQPQILDLSLDKIPSRAKRKVKNNDLIFGTVRPNLRHYGILTNPTANIIVSTGFAVLYNKSDLCSDLFLLFVSSEEVINYLQSKAEMSVSTYPSIKPEDILNLKIALPKVLNKYLTVLKTFTSFRLRKEKHLKEIDQLYNLRKLLLSKMATSYSISKSIAI